MTAVEYTRMTAAEHARMLIECHPDDPDATYQFLLPRDAVEATHIPLLPPTAPDREVWWQLSEDDRHVFRAVYFQTMVKVIKRRSYAKAATITAAQAWLHGVARKSVRAWLRWAAVRQANSEGLPWGEEAGAYQEASERLQGTVAHGKWRAMKNGYLDVIHILRAPAERQGG